MAYMKPGQPWLYDETTGDIVGVKDADGGEFLFARKAKVAKVFVGTGGASSGTGTTIPNSANPVGDYTTKLQFMEAVRDDLGLIDMANHRLYIPSGYSECRFLYNLAWGNNATGWRGCRVKNSAGSNFGNTRINSVGAGATTNVLCQSAWLPITSNSAPDSIEAGDYFEFWPAQTSGGDLTCGADLASSFVQLEVR